MKILKILIPAVIIKKVYGSKYKKPPLSDEEKDRLEDLEDDNS